MDAKAGMQSENSEQRTQFLYFRKELDKCMRVLIKLNGTLLTGKGLVLDKNDLILTLKINEEMNI